ncbi:MAG: LysE family transporter [Desulfobacula sp.]|nr:LysE family transporter [Desulfobacula sp.]
MLLIFLKDGVLMKVLLNGMLTGMFLQLALGPVFFYILSITIESNYINSLSAVAAVTIVDYIYIILSLIGIGRLLQKDKMKTVFGTVSSVILILFGLIILYKGLFFINDTAKIGSIAWTPLKSFTTCFILTVSSPLTIVFWSSVFSAKAVENNYQKKELVIFGIGTGLSTFLFLSLTMMILSLVKSNVPATLVLFLNCAVGVVLISYGLTRVVKIYKEM